MSLSPQARWRKNNPEKVKEIRDRYYAKNKTQINDRQREWRKANPNRKKPSSEAIRNGHYKYKYGITLDEYNRLLTQQGGVCAICQESETSVKKNGEIASLCIDHCHTTGKVRGLLCRMCNSALGKFKESLVILDRAKSYLKHGQQV